MDLFFVLSGFLIGRILLRYRSSKNYFSVFYARRALRIFPPYYLSVAVLFLLIQCGASDSLPWLTQHPFPAWIYVLYLQNFQMVNHDMGAHWLTVTWSLAIEEQFYLLLPLVVYLAPPRALPKILVGLILFAPIIRLACHDFGAYVLLPARMDALCIGVLIAYYHLEGLLQRALRNKQSFLLLAMALVFLLLGIYMTISKESMGGVAVHSILAILYGLLVTWALVLPTGSLAHRALSHWALAFLARTSYMVYLTHEVFAGLFHELMLHQPPHISSDIDAIVTVLALVATLAFAAVSYRYFEKPILAFGKGFQYQHKKAFAISDGPMSPAARCER